MDAERSHDKSHSRVHDLIRSKPRLWREWKDTDFCELETLARVIEAELRLATSAVPSQLPTDWETVLYRDFDEPMTKKDVRKFVRELWAHSTPPSPLAASGWVEVADDHCSSLYEKSPVVTIRKGGKFYQYRVPELDETLPSATLPLAPTPAMIEAGAQRLVRWETGKEKWPDAWGALDVRAVRNDAERCWRSMWLIAHGVEAPLSGDGPPVPPNHNPRG